MHYRPRVVRLTIKHDFFMIAVRFRLKTAPAASFFSLHAVLGSLKSVKFRFQWLCPKVKHSSVVTRIKIRVNQNTANECLVWVYVFDLRFLTRIPCLEVCSRTHIIGGQYLLLYSIDCIVHWSLFVNSSLKWKVLNSIQFHQSYAIAGKSEEYVYDKRRSHSWMELHISRTALQLYHSIFWHVTFVCGCFVSFYWKITQHFTRHMSTRIKQASEQLSKQQLLVLRGPGELVTISHDKRTKHARCQKISANSLWTKTIQNNRETKRMKPKNRRLLSFFSFALI